MGYVCCCNPDAGRLMRFPVATGMKVCHVTTTSFISHNEPHAGLCPTNMRHSRIPYVTYIISLTYA